MRQVSSNKQPITRNKERDVLGFLLLVVRPVFLVSCLLSLVSRFMSQELLYA
jgi:hypothetical protein